MDNFPTFFGALPALFAALPKGGKFVGVGASPDAQTQAPLTEQIDQGIVLSDDQGMAQRQIGNGCVQADALRALSGSGQHDSRIGTDQRMVWAEIAVMCSE